MKTVPLLFLFLMGVSPSVIAKANCQSYLNTLHNIQAKMRAGYSAAQGVKLAKKERNAYDKWWDCKRGKLKKKSSRKIAKEGNKKALSNARKRTITVQDNAFKPLTSNVTIKAKYPGIKQQAWLDFYQPKAECKSPSNLAIFAACLRDEQRQQRLFEQQ
ncbi:hypothetical protein [Thalassotalea sediminis]|uniref:hypothetical protein n=1 Tax=Thalassotalea sediminis TaxID=1759089 RepID=UPI002573C52D|nr:hypothetical protein [Thalassotalea sediminis]